MGYKTKRNLMWLGYWVFWIVAGTAIASPKADFVDTLLGKEAGYSNFITYFMCVAFFIFGGLWMTAEKHLCKLKLKEPYVIFRDTTSNGIKWKLYNDRTVTIDDNWKTMEERLEAIEEMKIIVPGVLTMKQNYREKNK